MSSARSISLLSFAAILLVASDAYADGACAQGERDTTVVERQMMTNVLERAKAALPAAPEGWAIGGYEEVSVPRSICKEAETTPWTYGIGRTFNRADNVAERAQLQADAGAALRGDRDAKQPRIDALMAKMQALGGELGSAAQSGNQERIDAINAEMEKLQQEMQTIFDEGPGQEQLAALGGLLNADTEMTITVQVNGAAVVDADLQSTTPPSGATHALRGETTRDGVTTARIVVLLGAWQPRDGGGLQTARRGTVSSAAAHSLSVTLTADPARIDSLLATIDFAALAALTR
jgi:hypothetical protein